MDKKAFGKRMQKYREQAGYSQEGLAEKIECSTIFISYMERGEKSPSLDTLIKLVNALNIPADSLLGDEINMYSYSQLKHLERRLTELPLKEQEKLLNIFDYIISAELNCQKE
ncbi:MAG: helix-turn-helix transcriptional regulator [Lachnospiraceae bacterium]|nr:helix-turn-helix transcriptional regulator [Lachnospiraceae bacterium]